MQPNLDWVAEISKVSTKPLYPFQFERALSYQTEYKPDRWFPYWHDLNHPPYA